MRDTVFCNNFRFVEYRFTELKHRDNSHGVDLHFIGLMKHGSGRIVTRDQVLELHTGDMFYIPKGCQYHSYWIPEGNVIFDSIGFLYFPTAAPNGCRLQKIDYDEELMAAFLPLSRSKTVNAASIGTLYSLLGLLEPRLLPAPSRKDAAVYEQLMVLLKKDPLLTVPEYAGLCGISESLLYHYVKQYTGKTPNRLRQECLCQKAAELLSTTSYTVEEICSRLGFSSAAYFRTVFESVYQKTPSQLRKEGSTI